MAIKYAILGFLSWRTLSGYDLKKLFGESMFLHWSGNNNQIYRTLVQLHKDGLVTSEVQHQERGPSRKLYTITEDGRVALRNWVLVTPESPQLRNPFLVQLAWADQLDADELDGMLINYEHEINMQLLMHREAAHRHPPSPDRTQRERYLWQMIAENRIVYYEAELVWVQKLRTGLAES